MKPKKWFSMLLALTMILALLPANAFSQIGPIDEPNYGFIPNSGEASVSKVDLVNMLEVARYYTEPRSGNEYNYRTNRIAMDSDGNAWVLNTGADGYLIPQQLQGSIVRIQGNTDGLTNTNNDPTAPLPFEEDEAVTVTNIGEPGDMPRAIAIDKDDFIWVGFYGSGELVKYQIVGNSVEPVESLQIDPPMLNYYEMKFGPDPDQMLYISSRASTPTPSVTNSGVWSFNPATGVFAKEWATNPYSLLIDPVTGQVYATNYGSVLWIKGATPETVPITGASQLRGMSFDATRENIWIADTSHNQVVRFNISTKISTPFALPSGITTPVGVGIDEAGLMWAICRNDTTAFGYIVAFNPDGTIAGQIPVGYRPYAYGDFVMPIPRYNIGGYKLDAEGSGLEGWTINLYKLTQSQDPDLLWIFEDSTTTDAYGKYCFDGLLVGEYKVSEVLQEGWEQISPENNEHFVSLPEGASNCEAVLGQGLFYNFINTEKVYGFCGYKLDSETGLGLVGWTIILKDVEGNEIHRTTTGIGGRYCFGDLSAGTYTVEEVGQDNWEQVFPAGGFHTVTLPEESMIFGIERTANKPIMRINPTDGSYVKIFDTNINSFNISGPNGLAFDSGKDVLYYVTYPYNSTLGYADLYSYKLGDTTSTKIGDLMHEIACADFYGGNYYSIAGGDKGATDDLYEVTFKPDGTVDDINKFAGISGDIYAWKFYGDIAISTEGLIYGVGRNDTSPYPYQFFSVNKDGTGFNMINADLKMPLQLAFGSDGVLYGFNINNGYYYTLDLATGVATKGPKTLTSQGFNDMASGIQYYNFENRTILGNVPAFKFYDSNVNGVFDEGEMPIADWKIQIYKGDLLVDTKFTDVNGEVMFTVPYGDYTIKEVMPIEQCWMATTDMEKSVTVERLITSNRVEFGNVCLGEGGGKTLGFWSNKNGMKVFLGEDEGASSFALLSGLNLKYPDGTNFDPTTYEEFRTWLLDGSATNMSYMLSVQLAAMELNVAKGLVDGEALIYVPELIGIANPLGFASVNNVMAAANEELGLHGTAFSEDEWRLYQEDLKNALDYANNNMNFLQVGPCAINY